MPLKLFGDIFFYRNAFYTMNNFAAGVAARFALLDALRQREVAVFVPEPRVKPERQVKEMEHRSGTFCSGLSAYLYVSRISIADRAPR